MTDPEPAAYTGFDLSRFFDRRVTLGNLLTIAFIIFYGTLFYSQIMDHISDSNIHHTQTEIAAEFDRKWEVRSKELFYEMKLNNSELEFQIKALSNEVAQMRKELAR